MNGVLRHQNEPGAAANPPAEDYAGRANLDDLRQAYRQSGEEARRQRARAEALEQQMAQFVAEQQRPQIPQRDVYGRISEYGLPADDLREAIRTEAANVATQMFQPIVRGFEARNTVLSEYSDYNKFESDVAQFINSDNERQQRYQRMFREDPAGAMEWAFLKFGDQRRKEAPAQNHGGVDPAAVSQAQIPASRAGDSRGIGIDPNAQAIDDAWKSFKETGNANQYARARIKQALGGVSFG